MNPKIPFLQTQFLIAVGLFALISAVSSCGSLSPAGFWLNFDQNFIDSTYSDQGHWGGERKIFWKTASEEQLSETELIQFAALNDWKIADGLTFFLTDSGFPILNLNIDEYPNSIFELMILPELKSGEYRVLIFDTN